ncbi:hypothetical protein FM102_14745 [Corynebacterium glutamicum]|nr:hypothetical protein FM102_14745 [Corynebacterium glutamicum]
MGTLVWFYLFECPELPHESVRGGPKPLHRTKTTAAAQRINAVLRQSLF